MITCNLLVYFTYFLLLLNQLWRQRDDCDGGGRCANLVLVFVTCPDRICKLNHLINVLRANHERTFRTSLSQTMTWTLDQQCGMPSRRWMVRILRVQKFIGVITMRVCVCECACVCVRMCVRARQKSKDSSPHEENKIRHRRLGAHTLLKAIFCVKILGPKIKYFNYWTSIWLFFLCRAASDVKCFGVESWSIELNGLMEWM